MKYICISISINQYVLLSYLREGKNENMRMIRVYTCVLVCKPIYQYISVSLIPFLCLKYRYSLLIAKHSLGTCYKGKMSSGQRGEKYGQTPGKRIQDARKCWNNWFLPAWVHRLLNLPTYSFSESVLSRGTNGACNAKSHASTSSLQMKREAGLLTA